MSLPKLNPVEPPWYGPVCPVVGEGRHREVSPFPDQQVIWKIKVLWLICGKQFLTINIGILLVAASYDNMTGDFEYIRQMRKAKTNG
jgi:hypothetical protein